jgi:hypothetical protein
MANILVRSTRFDGLSQQKLSAWETGSSSRTKTNPFHRAREMNRTGNRIPANVQSNVCETRLSNRANHFTYRISEGGRVLNLMTSLRFDFH